MGKEPKKHRYFNEPQISSSLMKTSFRKGERGGSIKRYIMIWATHATDTINLLQYLDVSSFINMKHTSCNHKLSWLRWKNNKNAAMIVLWAKYICMNLNLKECQKKKKKPKRMRCSPISAMINCFRDSNYTIDDITSWDFIQSTCAHAIAYPKIPNTSFARYPRTVSAHDVSACI